MQEIVGIPERLFAQRHPDRCVVDEVSGGEIITSFTPDGVDEVLHDPQESSFVVGAGHECLVRLELAGVVVVYGHDAVIAVTPDVTAFEADADELGVGDFVQSTSPLEDEHDSILSAAHCLVVRL